MTLIGLNSNWQQVKGQLLRGHSKRIEKQRSKLEVKLSYFSNPVVNLWNKVTESVVNAKTVNTIKKIK